MAKLIINTNAPGDLISVGKAANDRSGDPLRTAFTKVNDAIDKIDLNFTDLYNAIGADVQIPAQANNDGKFLTTNGTTLSWALVSTNGAGTANTGFIDDRIYNINGVIVSNDDLVHGATARLTLPAYGASDPVSLLNYYGGLSITTGVGPNETSNWTFTATGGLTLPKGGNINNFSATGSSTGTIHTFATGANSETPGIDNANSIGLSSNTNSQEISTGWVITFNNGQQKLVSSAFAWPTSTITLSWSGLISLTRDEVWPLTVQSADYSSGVNITKLEITPEGTTTWAFDSNGIIKLPAGGDIVDSTGASVLTPTVIDGGNASTTF